MTVYNDPKIYWLWAGSGNVQALGDTAGDKVCIGSDAGALTAGTLSKSGIDLKQDGDYVIIAADFTQSKTFVSAIVHHLCYLSLSHFMSINPTKPSTLTWSDGQNSGKFMVVVSDTCLPEYLPLKDHAPQGLRLVNPFLKILQEDPGVRFIVAKEGGIEYLDILVNDDDVDVLLAVARNGTERHLKVLAHHELEEVRVAVAERSAYIDDIMDILVHDKSYLVLAAVAESGFKKYLDILVKHPDWNVQKLVIEYAYRDHLNILVHHDKPIIRQGVAQYGYKEHHDILVNDPDPGVRYYVANYGGKEHVEQLINDAHEPVRDSARIKFQAFKYI